MAAGWAGGQTGDRLFVLVQVGLLAVLVLDGLWSAAVAMRARSDVALASTDAVVGQSVQATISVAGWRRPALVRMAFPAESSWVSIEAPASGASHALAAVRGVFTSVVVEVLSKDPLGLAGFSCRREVVLPRPLVIGPRPVPYPEAPFPPVVDDEVGTLAAAQGSDVVRGVRDHRAGDPLRRVHWPTTARTGRLIVKELEEPRRAHATVLLVVDLGDGGPATEPAAGSASWIATEALRRGYHVVLATFEASGPVTAEVATPLASSRRLARAVPGRPQPPPGCEANTINVAVTSSGQG